MRKLNLNQFSVLQSMICGKPIVTIDYWREYIKCVRQKSQQLPKVEDYLPILEEAFLLNDPNLLKVNLNRRRLFMGKIFAFMTTKHMQKYENIIQLAQGKCINLDKTKCSRSTLLKKEYIPIQYSIMTQSQGSQTISNLTSYIIQHGRRVVPEDEIGLALFHTSIAEFCNPDHRIISRFEVSTIDLTDECEQMKQTPCTINKNTESDIVIMETIDIPDEVNHEMNQPNVGSEKPQENENNNLIDLGNNMSEAPIEQDIENRIVPTEDCSKRKQNESSDSSASISTKRRKIDEKQSESQKSSTTDGFSQSYSQSSGFISRQSRSNQFVNNMSSSSSGNAFTASASNKNSNKNDKKSTKRKQIFDKDSDDFEFDFSNEPTNKKNKKRTKSKENDDEEFHFTQPKMIKRSTQTSLQSSTSNSIKNENCSISTYGNNSINKMSFVKKIVSSPQGFLISKFKKEFRINDSVREIEDVFIYEEDIIPKKSVIDTVDSGKHKQNVKKFKKVKLSIFFSCSLNIVNLLIVFFLFFSFNLF